MRIILTTCLLMISMASYGQEALFPKRTFSMSIGYGFGVGGERSVFSAVPVQLEYGVFNIGTRASFGVGLLTSFGWGTYPMRYYGQKERDCIYQAAPQFLFHVTALKKWEFYAGVGAGIQVRTIRGINLEEDGMWYFNDSYTTQIKFYPQIKIGSRVQIGNHLGIYLEAGYRIILLNAGVSIRF